MAVASLQTQGERAGQLFRERIRSGEYPPGSRLTLRALAQEIGTSVIPIRDALAQLEQEGLVEGAAGRGWRVSLYGPERLRDLAVLREALECQVARMCALHASDEELDELAFLGRQVDGATNRQRSNVLEQRFHLRLAEIADSDALLSAIKRTDVLQLTFGRVSANVARHHMHERLVRAISRRDPDAAERAMRTHVVRNASPPKTRARESKRRK